jgi:hypothetical protein
VPILRELESPEDDREPNVERIVYDRLWGTAVFVDCLPIWLPILRLLESPEDDGVLGVGVRLGVGVLVVDRE